MTTNTTNIRIESSIKDDLDRLRRVVAAKENRDYTLSEIIDKLIKNSEYYIEFVEDLAKDY